MRISAIGQFFLYTSLSKCFVDNGYVYLSLVNFVYRQVDYLLKCWRRTLLLYYLEIIRSLSMLFGTIVVNKWKANILLTESKNLIASSSLCFLSWCFLSRSKAFRRLNVSLSLNYYHLYYIIGLQIGLRYLGKDTLLLPVTAITLTAGWFVDKSNIIVLLNKQ